MDSGSLMAKAARSAGEPANVVSLPPMKGPSTAQRTPTAKLERFGALYGSSPRMRGLYAMIEKVAPTDATVFIAGESGTGKELVARTVHEMSGRRNATFLAIHSGAIPANLIEAELFGHERGSFTGATCQHKGYFERVGGGTLFLDEITEMSPEMQGKLLRVLESERFRRVGGDGELTSHGRIIAATNIPLDVAIKNGKLRVDLMYRLLVFPLHVPPLRERGHDILGLAQHFLSEFNAASGCCKRLAASSGGALLQRAWPGNVRELRNVVQRAFILADDELTFDEVGLDSLQESVQEAVAALALPALAIPIGSSLAEAQQKIIYATLEFCGGNKRRTCEILGVSLKTLYNRLTTYATSTGSSPRSRVGRPPRIFYGGSAMMADD